MDDSSSARAELVHDAGGEAVQVVRSAEQVALHLPIAGPGSRILAYAIDYTVIVLIEIAGIALLMLSTPLLAQVLEIIDPWLEVLRGGKAETQLPNALLIGFALLILVGLVIESIYFLISEAISGGRSLGKAAVGLRVVGDDGPLSGRASLVRNLLRMVDMLPSSYVVGLIAMLASPRGQRLGDLAAGTLVVRLDRAMAALPIAPFDESGSPFRFSRVQLAGLGSTEKTLLRQTLRRLESLDAEQTAHVVQRTATVLRARLAMEQLPPGDDERFLRALLAAVDRR